MQLFGKVTSLENKKITYKELHREVCKLANGLKSLGVKKGDRVTIYLPMIPEAAYAMLACSRIGAIHSVVFGGFAPESLKDRVMDCSSNTIITANEGIRGEEKFLTFKCREAVQGLEIVKNVIVVNRTNKETAFSDKEISYTSLISEQAEVCSIVEQNSEDPLFILYTSGSTGNQRVLTLQQVTCYTHP